MQLFTHLLSSYLQGMGDFFSALPRGGSPTGGPSPSLLKGRELIPAEFKDIGVLLLPLGEGWDGASMLDGTHPWQLCRSCDFIAQG